jgi:hypothetical protein
MHISPDAIRLSIIWAKKFQPWLWDKNVVLPNGKKGCWNQTSLQRGQELLRSNQEQLQCALNDKWTVDMIADVLRKTSIKTKVPHIYQLLAGTGIPDMDEANLIPAKDPCHRALFDGLLIKQTFTLDDVLKYQAPLFPPTEVTSTALWVFVKERGLDCVLFAIDAAKRGDLALYSPWGLVLYMEAAESERKSRLDQLCGLGKESGVTRGAY